MITKTIIVYTIVDDILKSINHPEDKRSNMSDAEVITTGIISAMMFSGNVEKTRESLKETKLIPDMLSKSRLNRRLHKLAYLIEYLITQLGEFFKEANESMEYTMDSFPVPVCHNIRISRSKIITGEEYRGYNASKRQYFYGVKVHIISTSDGIPVEIVITPGSYHDSQALELLPFNLPQNSDVYSDSGYTDYSVEDALKELDGINLCPVRKSNSKRFDEPSVALYKNFTRKKIETVFSKISNFFPKKIHAVTAKGFLLKIVLFIFGYTIKQAFC